MNTKNGVRPVHPGEILREELDLLGISANALSKDLDVPVNRVTMILNGQRGVSADTATLAQLTEEVGASPSGDRNGSRDREACEAQIGFGNGSSNRCAYLNFGCA